MPSVTFRSILATLAFALLVACGAGNNTLSEAAFQEEWADAWCDRQHTCATADFEADWTDQADCVDDQSDGLEFASFWGDLVCGAFDPNQASTCVDAVRAGTCEQWADESWRAACDCVYGC